MIDEDTPPRRLQRAQADWSGAGQMSGAIERGARHFLVAAALDLAEGIDMWELPEFVGVGRMESDDFAETPERWAGSEIRPWLHKISSALKSTGTLLDAIDATPSGITPAMSERTLHQAAMLLVDTASDTFESAVSALGVAYEDMDDFLGRYDYLHVGDGRRARLIHASSCDPYPGAAQAWWNALKMYASIDPERLTKVVAIRSTAGHPWPGTPCSPSSATDR
ncbi:hypothetical protein [Amycolatopsis sp. cmx-4-61]|uniref:hypothetical protein n=1 Tax=Amycolatopsis sp. cmx-4-61 TaxID=2790937 RepID=UPI00397D0FF5